MSRVIRWFVHNPVAANLAMWVFLVGGVSSLLSIQREEFPSIDLEMIRVSVVHLGATPEEAEEAICVRVEEAIEGAPDVDRILSLAVEGACTVTVELVTGADVDRALDEIKNRVDGLDTFPSEAEKPVVSRVVMRNNVVRVAVSGDTDPGSLKTVGQQLRDEIAAIPGVSQVDLSYTLPYEVSIEVSEDRLRRHGLTLSQVADAVRRSSLDLPGGSVRTREGEVLFRTVGQAYRGEEFESIVVLTREDGTALTLGEIGRVVDGFEEGDLFAIFEGQPAIVVEVLKIGDEDILEISEKVFAYLDEARTRMPEGIALTVFNDESLELQSRLRAMTGNARSGLVLVLLVLGLFLRFRLAMWVAAGVPIAMAGALMLFPLFGITISTLSVMAFILVLGILVDDAIVVGESVYTHERAAESQVDAAVNGTLEVYVPVFFGVMTTMAAFLPAFVMEGRMGQMFSVLSGTAILCLAFSLIESQFILPAHLAHRRTRKSSPSRLRALVSPITSRWTRFQDIFSAKLEHLTDVRYRGALERAVEFRYVTVAIAIGTLILSFALVASGRARFQFHPSVEGDRLTAEVVMPPGSPVRATEAAVHRLERAAEQLRVELDRGWEGPSNVQFVMSMVGGAQGGGGGPMASSPRAGGSHLAEVRVELLPFDEREVDSGDALARWRELTGPIPDAIGLTFSAVAFGFGDPIDIELTGGAPDALPRAADALRSRLATYPGVYDITDSFRGGKQEVRLALKPEARPLGLTLDDLGRQVRQAFYGEEVQRVQRGRDDVKVMVRYPEDQRASIADLEAMHIRAVDGTELPFGAVADAAVGRGFSTIRRTDRQRVVNVTADVDRAVATPEAILDNLLRDLPEILAAYPGVTHSMGGEQRESSIAMGGMKRGAVLALLLIYALLAIPLGSYTQPLIIMSVIPFGTVGAIVGHFVMGQAMMFFSVLGIIALAGVVVNSSLVLVHFVNRRREQGQDLRSAVVDAGVVRFRPIFLTSLTTFIGLIPLMLEKDPAAFMVIPMAISLAYGVVFASAVTLFLVPSLYAILADLQERRSPDRVASAPAPEVSAAARVGVSAGVVAGGRGD